MSEGEKNEQSPVVDNVSPKGDSPHEDSVGQRRQAQSKFKTIGIVVLAIVLYLLLLDAAIETFLNDSPLKWWVVGIAGVYAVLSTLLWRRIGWPAKAALSLFVLLGLFVFTAWWPEGLTKGVALARQPTSTVLSAVTALAILLAGIGLMPLKFIPIPVRVAVGLLAAYGVAAFGLGIKTEIPYPDLFRGRSFWENLPYWSQGAFVGSFVIGLALLVQLFYGLLKVRGQALRTLGVQVLVLGASLAITVGGFRELLRIAPATTRSATLTAEARAPGTLAPIPTSTATPQAGPSPPAGAQIDARMAREITDTMEVRTPATEFPDDAKRVYVSIRGSYPDPYFSAQADWIAVKAEGVGSNTKVARSYLQTAVSREDGAWGPKSTALWMDVPPQGFAPGDYRVDLTLTSGGVRSTGSLPFKIVPLLPPAALLDQRTAPRGYNIALAALGGKVESTTSEYSDANWAAANLIDGASFMMEGRSCRTTCGWSTKDATVPQEVVFSFYQGREAVINALVIDTTTSETIGHPDRIAKHIEVWTSTTSATGGFTKVSGARLQRRPGEQVIALPATRAKFAKVRILSHYGGSRIQLGEVKIIEARDGTASILADALKNLALPVLGGAIVRFTSTYRHAPIGGLIDASPQYGWRSDDGPYGPASYLPQEFVFAFRGDQVALIERIVLAPNSQYDASTWPQVVTVLVSSDSPLDGFQEVGQFTLTQDPGDQAFPINKRARFVKLQILKNFGGRNTSLGKVKIFEGSAQGYESILLSSDAAVGAGSTAGAAQVDETGVAVETESNNSAAEANPLELGRRVKGSINPLGEHDHFKLSIPGSSPSVLTLELLGRPNIRTSLALLDAAGKTTKRFDPGQIPGHRALFSWMVNPGDHIVQVTEPPISLVLIWDTSGSMDKASVENLRQAVEAYLDQVRPSERLNLIRFSGGGRLDNAGNPVEVLLPEFTSDRERLKAAAQGKFFAKGGTPFYDAVARGIELLGGVQGNRAIVVMTDGEDTTSRLKHEGFWKVLEEKRIRLYTIGLGTELQTYVPGIGASGNRVLTHVAAATNGRFFFARTAEELRGFYQQIADELRTISTYYLKATLSQGPGSLAVAATGERLAAVSAPSQIELILDASGSMKRKLEGRQMMDIAKDVMSQIIKGLPEDAQVALRFYGHRIREGRPGDCRDTELVFPFGKIDKERMLARVAAVKALGTTPIDYTLRQMAGDFGRTPGEKLIILVTDGKEECKGDPAAAVAELQAKGLKLRLNIVGFALVDVATKRDMERVAQLTGGKFFDAANARALSQAIEQSLAVPYEVLDAAGEKVGGGLTGQGTISVPEGIYTVIVKAAGKPITIPNVKVSQNRSTKLELRKEGQEVGVKVVGP